MARFANFPAGRPLRGPKVFICYRHLDSKAHVGRLRDRLHTTLGPDAAFLDKDDLLPGGEFPEEIAETIKTSDALLVVVGPNWLSEENRRRLHEPNDFVRQEVAVGLRSEGVRVIPVLVDGGGMPRADELPEEIKALTRRTAIKLSDDHWDYDTQRLVEALRGLAPREHTPPSEKSTRPFAHTLAGNRLFVAALLAVAAVALTFFVVKYVSRPRTLDQCLEGRARALGIPPDRVRPVERGAFHYAVVEEGQPKEGAFLIKFTDSGQDLGAVALNYSPARKQFDINAVIGPDCADNPRYRSEDNPGAKLTLYDWHNLLVRFREGDKKPYRLRIGEHIGEHGNSIRASFDLAPDAKFIP